MKLQITDPILAVFWGCGKNNKIVEFQDKCTIITFFKSMNLNGMEWNGKNIFDNKSINHFYQMSWPFVNPPPANKNRANTFCVHTF